MKRTTQPETPALTCETCRYFDRRANWCKVSATWRSGFTRRCTYGEMLAKQIKQSNNQTTKQ